MRHPGSAIPTWAVLGFSDVGLQRIFYLHSGPPKEELMGPPLVLLYILALVCLNFYAFHGVDASEVPMWRVFAGPDRTLCAKKSEGNTWL